MDMIANVPDANGNMKYRILDIGLDGEHFEIHMAEIQSYARLDS